MRNTVIGIGAATWDHLMLVPEFPASEGVTQALAVSQDGGGPVATALCVLASLGSPTMLLDSQSDDLIGRQILRALSDHGVDATAVRVHLSCVSAQAHILVRQRDGARHIFFVPATAPELQSEDVDPYLIRGAALVHINGRHESAARRAVALAIEAGVPVSFDGGAGRYRESIRDLVFASSLRILAKDFALKFTGEGDLSSAADSLLADKPSLLVITDGIAGSQVWSEDEPAFHQPAFPVPDVVDTTGCGDVFHGAFLHGWLQKWPVRQTAEFASKLASETARGLGGRHALRNATPLSPVA
jgi:sugar/nucleoside kinase (ribokinase family)